VPTFCSLKRSTITSSGFSYNLQQITAETRRSSTSRLGKNVSSEGTRACCVHALLQTGIVGAAARF